MEMILRTLLLLRCLPCLFGSPPDFNSRRTQQPITDATPFRRRRFVPWNVADDDGRLMLIGPGDDLELKPDDGDALDVALSGDRFTPADLPCDDAIALARTLWAAGYLERLGD